MHPEPEKSKEPGAQPGSLIQPFKPLTEEKLSLSNPAVQPGFFPRKTLPDSFKGLACVFFQNRPWLVRSIEL